MARTSVYSITARVSRGEQVKNFVDANYLYASILLVGLNAAKSTNIFKHQPLKLWKDYWRCY